MANPEGLHVLPGCENDPRRVDNIFDGFNRQSASTSTKHILCSFSCLLRAHVLNCRLSAHPVAQRAVAGRHLRRFPPLAGAVHTWGCAHDNGRLYEANHDLDDPRTLAPKPLFTAFHCMSTCTNLSAARVAQMAVTARSGTTTRAEYTHPAECGIARSHWTPTPSSGARSGKHPVLLLGPKTVRN